MQHGTFHGGLDLLAHPAGMALSDGTAVAVRNKFDGSWCSGFVVDRAVRGSGNELIGYIVRRFVDQFVLSAAIPLEDIIPVRVDGA